MIIDRCVCKNITFAELLERSERSGKDLQTVSRETGCGRNCGMCVAYLKRCFATGETVFTALLPAERLEP